MAAEERKVVSVLFVDLVEFTARSDRADPEDVQAMLRPYHARVKEEIERFGGTVEKFVGDAVMAVFGAPTAHEDDAERAVRAALRVQQAILELNEADPSLGLAARAAVNTGEAVVALGARPEAGESFVTGDVVNTASRLQQEAPAGGVVVGEVTYRATSDLVDYARLAPVEVRGKAEPIPIWLARSARSRFGSDLDLRPQPAFIGRAAELALLEQTYRRAVHEPSVQLVTLTGEPGVGKSRLVREFFSFIDDLPELVWWRQGRCLPYGEGITFWALGEIVKAQAGILESDGPEEASRKLDDALAAQMVTGSDREWVRARLTPLVGLAAEEPTEAAGREESFASWRRFLEDLAATRPLVLVFEDLHWADPAMLAFVDHLVDWSTALPMVVICTARPELYERHHGWGGGKRNSTTIALSPLSDEESARLIASLLSEAVLPADTQAALLDRAGGNPLYAEEFVRMLTDRGILRRHGRAWQIAEDADIPVPESVQALIAGRLDTLGPERKSLLHDAAVVGKVFWSGALAFMGGLPEEEVRRGLHELARKELVRPSRTSSVQDQAECSFWHLLVRDVAYGQIPRAERARKHRAAAEWIEDLAADRVTDHAELLAHHYGRSLELARASGDSEAAVTLEEPARRFLVMAGDRAQRLDVGNAISYYGRALALLPAAHPDRPRVLAKAAETAALEGDLAEAVDGFEEAIAAFRERGDTLDVGESMSNLSGVLWQQGDTARGWEVLSEAIDLLEREPPGPQLARVYIRTAGAYWTAGIADRCLEWSEKALAMARELGLGAALVRGLQFHGGARAMLGDLGGLEDMREAVRLGLELGLGQETGTAYVNLGDWVWWDRGPAEGLKVHREGVEFSERRGLTHNAVWTRAELTWMLFDLGEWDELLDVSGQVIEWDRAHGGTQIQAIALPYRAHVLAQRGDHREAAGLAQEFLPRAREIGEPQVIVPALTVAASLEETAGRTDRAAALLEEMIDATRDRSQLRAWASCGSFRASGGRADLIERLLEGVDGPGARNRHTVAGGWAILAEARGDLDGACGLYELAADGWASYGNVPERGQALLGAGRTLVGLGREAEAIDPLTRARDVFAGLAAAPLVAEADGLLQRATARTS